VEAVAVDWSGAWDARRQIALARARDGELLELRCGLSRNEVAEVVIELAQRSDVPLAVGLDFAFSLPAWFLRERGLASAMELWAFVEREGEQWLADSEPPFWGRTGSVRPVLVDHFRRTEARLAPVAGIGVKSAFQISGAGTVGTGSLRGMPFLARFREAGLAVWPFDPPTLPVVVEIYPRLLTGPVRKGDRASREAYLSNLPGVGAHAAFAELAADSEDAFDAAVSALVMSRHAAELEHLPPVDDPDTLLEGEIWAPAADWATPAVDRATPVPAPVPPGSAYSGRYPAALAYAAELHAAQYRKSTPVPYVAHLLTVSAYVFEAGGDEDQAIAGLLHDAVEDQGGAQTLEEIRRRFGERVAQIVEVCTDADTVPKPPWRGRKEAHIAHVRTAPIDALLVVAADKLHNSRSIVIDVTSQGPSVWERFKGGRDGTLWYYGAVLEVLSRRIPACPLVPQLAEVVERLNALPG
jgi:hypothetical protein